MQISAKWKVSENRESRTDRAPLKVQLRGKQCVVMSHITIWILSFGPEYCFVSWALCFAVCCSEKGMNWWHVSIVILYVIFSLIFMEKCNILAPLFSQYTPFSCTNGNLSNCIIFQGQKKKLKKNHLVNKPFMYLFTAAVLCNQDEALAKGQDWESLDYIF